ncbi:IS1096 element passenger TnpR family protein [Fulvivirga sediminis]|uniref:Plasmid pRiA4b Orf3-like domain-containing protein n=1 Tax=Fulvivirga sediminis TaxID=2803949 RepID=A0A937FD79_9BACT|nr:hypothetical protein [Fulvivirga sediminis]MBL3658393.1 hypothetical protein [Fulvivirga sediminis]
MAKIKKLPSSEIYQIEAMIPSWDEQTFEVSTKSPYRILAVRPDMSLHELGLAVLSAFKFDYDHLFGFYENFNNPLKSKVSYEIMEDTYEEDDEFIVLDSSAPVTLNMDDYVVADIFIRKGKRWLMLFDYGEAWHFWLKFIGKEYIIPNKSYPYILKSKYKAPSQYPDDY